MDRWKAELGRGREKRRVEERRSKKTKSQNKEDTGARKAGKVAKHCVFPMICGSRGWKSELAKAAGAEPAGQMRDEKLHAVVARSTFRSQNVQNTSASDHFWKLRCQKSAGAKHISKSKCTKHTRFGPLLEVEMSKKCTPLWREAHFEVKSAKSRATVGSWDVEKVHAVVARSTFRSQKCKKLRGTEHFWTFRCRFMAFAALSTSIAAPRWFKRCQIRPKRFCGIDAGSRSCVKGCQLLSCNRHTKKQHCELSQHDTHTWERRRPAHGLSNETGASKVFKHLLTAPASGLAW